MRRTLFVLVLLLLLVPVVQAQEIPAAPFIPMPMQFDFINDWLSQFQTWFWDVVNFWTDIFWGFINWLQNIVYALYEAWNGNYDRLSQTFGILGDIAGFIVKFTKPVLDFFIYILENLGEIVELAGIAIQVLLTLLGKVLGWIVQISAIILGIFSGILGAPPEQLPGLPRCISAPMESNVCAVWYMFEYTVFSDGTPGEYLVPMLVLGIDILVLSYCVKAVIRAARIFEGVTHVG